MMIGEVHKLFLLVILIYTVHKEENMHISLPCPKRQDLPEYHIFSTRSINPVKL